MVISSPVYESAVQTHELDYFDSMMIWSPISGSVSEFRLDIDLTTMEATAQPVDYQVLITDPVPFPQIGAITRDLSTTALAGFAFLPEYPGFPFFCDTCTLVPGAPYDPASGKINAVGMDLLVAPDIPGLIGFSRAGDLRLSESPAQSVSAHSTAGLWGLAIFLTGFAFLIIRGERRSTRNSAEY